MFYLIYDCSLFQVAAGIYVFFSVLSRVMDSTPRRKAPVGLKKKLHILFNVGMLYFLELFILGHQNLLIVADIRQLTLEPNVFLRKTVLSPKRNLFLKDCYYTIYLNAQCGDLISV